MGEVGLVSSKVGEVGGYGVGVGKFNGGRGERGCFAKAGGREESKMQSRLYLKLTSYIATPTSKNFISNYSNAHDPSEVRPLRIAS